MGGQALCVCVPKAYLIPLFWATLCRDSLDTAEMTWGDRMKASVISQETRKSS